MKLLVKYNPYHDSRGRFTSAGAATSFSLLANPAHRARSIEREKERTANMKTYPPGGGKLTQEAMANIDSYLAPFTQYKPTDIDSPDKIEGIRSTAKALTETYKNYVEEGLLTLEDLPNRTDMRLVGADGELMAIGYATKFIPSEIRLITKKTMVVTGKIYLNTDQELAEYAKSKQSRMTFAKTDNPGRQAFIDHEMGHVLHLTIKNRYAEQIYQEAREESARNKATLARNPNATGVKSHNDISVEAAGKLNKKIYQLDNKVAKIIEDELSTGKLLVERRLTQNSLRGVLTAQSNKPRPLSSHDQTKIKHNLSSYATTNIDETIAEAWTEYRNSKNPRPIAKKIGQLIESELRATHTRDAVVFEKSRKLEKHNPYHDARGRFASPGGGSSGKVAGGVLTDETLKKYGYQDMNRIQNHDGKVILKAYDQAADAIVSHYKDAGVSITKEEARAGVEAISLYTDFSHKDIKNPTTPENEAKKKAMLNLVEKSPPMTETVYRGTTHPQVYNPGDTLNVRELSSFTVNKNIALDFATSGRGTVPTVVTIKKNFNGMSIEHLAHFREEKEIVSGGAKTYKVVEVINHGKEIKIDSPFKSTPRNMPVRKVGHDLIEYVVEEVVTKMNPYHDALGRFTFAAGGSIGGTPHAKANGKDISGTITGEKAVALYKLRNTESNKEDRAMVAIAKQQGFTGKPEVLSNEEFDKRVQDLGDNAIVMYRGMTDSAYVYQLKNGEYYGGIGCYGSGIYTSTSAGHASGYTIGRDSQNKFAMGNNDNIAKIVVDRRNVKLITVEEENTEYKKYFEKENAKNDDSIPGQCRKEVLSDAGRFLASKGYDGMEVTFGDPTYVMFNRTALTISDGKITKADFAGG